MTLMYTGDGLAEAIIFMIVCGVAVFVTFIIFIFKGRKTGNIALKRAGYFGAGVMLVCLGIYAASESIKHWTGEARKSQAAAEFLQSVPTVYAPDLSYIEKDYKTKKPELRAVLYRDDVYEFTFDKFASEPRLRGYEANEANKAAFHPESDDCNFTAFFPGSFNDYTDDRCIEVSRDPSGNVVYTNRGSLDSRNFSAYFGMMRDDMILVYEFDSYASEYHVSDVRNPQTQDALSVFASLKRYEKKDLDKIFHANASLGITE